MYQTAAPISKKRRNNQAINNLMKEEDKFEDYINKRSSFDFPDELIKQYYQNSKVPLEYIDTNFYKSDSLLEASLMFSRNNLMNFLIESNKHIKRAHKPPTHPKKLDPVTHKN